MKLNFCTLFNSAYLSRGLTLYQSLLRNCNDFHLYVFAFDDLCYDYLNKLNLKSLTVISLKEFEDRELLNVKSSRSAGEYCWTCTASTVLFSITKFNLDHCTYIDADMCFYNNPEVLLNEMGDKSVLITEHRYSEEYDQSAISGKYCVQFVTFKNNEAGLKVLKKWRNDCINWCYNRVEDGKFGDQKYLDNWTTESDAVHELKHLGGGVAPWNVQQYTFTLSGGNKIVGKEINSGKQFDLIFYHYHSLKFLDKDIVLLSDTEYKITEQQKKLLYKPYVKELMDNFHLVKKSNSAINANGVFSKSPYQPMSLSTVISLYRDNIRASKRNVLGKKLLSRIRNHHYYSIFDFIKS